MKRLQLSEGAERSLDVIGAYSRENFGRVRGDAYVRNLLDRCRRLSRGHIPHQSCRIHFADDLSEDLRFIRAEQHVVIFVETPVQVIIVDFIHQSADIGGRLGGPGS